MKIPATTPKKNSNGTLIGTFLILKLYNFFIIIKVFLFFHSGTSIYLSTL